MVQNKLLPNFKIIDLSASLLGEITIKYDTKLDILKLFEIP